MTNTKARYDKIGVGYDSTRKADKYLSQKMFEFIKSDIGGTYLEVGCGTGNYTSALNQMGLKFIGIDPSDEMLSKAKEKNSSIEWKKGTAEKIDLNSESVDGVLLCLTIHHWNDLEQGFREIHRVLKRNGKVVLFTTLPSQNDKYWLNHYFPQMIKDSNKILPTLEETENAFKNANLEIIHQESYFIKPDLEDCFFYCGKHNPEVYFREEIRNAISSFSLLSNRVEVEQGLKEMRADIDSGKIKEIIANYENDLGDYLFIIGQKK